MSVFSLMSLSIRKWDFRWEFCKLFNSLLWKTNFQSLFTQDFWISLNALTTGFSKVEKKHKINHRISKKHLTEEKIKIFLKYFFISAFFQDEDEDDADLSKYNLDASEEEDTNKKKKSNRRSRSKSRSSHSRSSSRSSSHSSSRSRSR